MDLASEGDAADATVTREALSSRTFASGRYEAVRTLPEGAQKVVYVVRDTKLDRECALSLIKADQFEADDVERLRREAQAMARLGTHAHLVTIFDLGEEDGRPYIVSEFVGGGELKHEIRAAGGALALERALSVTRDVARALAFAHARGIVHRDIKPANIWLTSEGAAKLGDFGLVSAAGRSRMTQAGRFVGTAAYIAPEQALGGAADARSDLYALGCVLYEMVTGHVPFAGSDMVSVISQHIETAPVAPSWHNANVPHALDALILRLLAKSPDDRPQSADALLAELDAMSGASVQPIVAPTVANPLDRLAAGVFVGREQELDEVRRGLDDALSGRGQLMLLVGEPGIGKTRTANELCTYARLRGALVLVGRCYEGDGAPAYWPWVQALRSYVAECDAGELRTDMGPGAADIAQMVSEVRALMPDIEPPPQLEADQARFRLFDSITSFLKNAAHRRPIVLLLDDLHWADKASLLMLQFLARNLAGARLLVLGTYRDVELGRQHPLAQTLGELAREQVGTRVLLRGLSEADVGRYIELTTGVAPADALVSSIFRETEGNPFFLSEVVRLLVTDGRLRDAAETVSRTAAIPQSVREVIGRRLDHLTDACNAVLTTAAVIGREFGLDALERLTQLDGNALLASIEEAEAARVVEEAPGQRGMAGRYTFSHALIRETLYGELSTTRRVRLHKQIGETLEALYAGNVDAHVAELAYHFGEAASAGDVEKAVDYAERAGDRSVSLYAWEEAAGHYQRALEAMDLLPAPDGRRKATILRALGDALAVTGDLAGYRDAFARAAGASRTSGDPEGFALAALGFATPFNAGYEPEVVALLEEALVLLPPGDSAHRAMVTARLAHALLFGKQRNGATHGEPVARLRVGDVLGDHDQHERMRTLGQEALNMARRLGDKAALTYTLGRIINFSTAIASRGQGRSAGQERLTDQIDEALRLAEETGNKRAALLVPRFRVTFSLRLGDRDVVDAAIDLEERLSRELRTPGLAASWRALQARLDGRLDEVEALAQQQVVDSTRNDRWGSQLIFGAQLTDLRRAQGRLDEIEGAIRSLGARSGSLFLPILALIHREQDRRDEARAVFDEVAADAFASIPDDMTRTMAFEMLADVCCYLNDGPRAAALYEELQRFEGSCLVFGLANVCTGSASTPLGALATVLGRFDDAERHFVDAIAMNRKVRAPTWVAEAQFGYASMLLQRGAPGDSERASPLLAESLATAEATGMGALIGKIRRVAEAARGA